MSIVGKKQKIFGSIAAARTLTDGFPKIKKSNSFKSVNNDGNSITFLTDLIKSLIGYNKLITVVVDFLTYSIPEIEKIIKSSLKSELKTIVSCGVNPSTPSFMSTTGLVIELKKIDFLDMFKTDPNSEFGPLLYNDITPILTNSTDFNTFIYGLIQDEGVIYTWSNMLDIKFNSIGTGGNPNNILTIKTSASFNGNDLTNLNNNFIDSLNVLNTTKLVNCIIDSLFGSISSAIKKTTKQLEREARINNVIDSISSSDSEIDDSYFTFSNEDVINHEKEANLRRNGLMVLDVATPIDASIPYTFLTDFTSQMMVSNSTLNNKTIIINNLNEMAEQTTANSNNNVDNLTIKLNFIQSIINKLVRGITNSIISPKIILIFLINFKIVYGTTTDFKDGVDFIKLTKNLFKMIIKKITQMLVQKLIKIVLKEISILVGKYTVKKNIEKNKSTKAQLLSLVGVPQEAIRVIKGLL